MPNGGPDREDSRLVIDPQVEAPLAADEGREVMSEAVRAQRIETSADTIRKQLGVSIGFTD